MWRLKKGEGLQSLGPHLSVVMIGNSDLTYASFQVCPVYSYFLIL